MSYATQEGNTQHARAKTTNTLVRTLRPGESIEVSGKTRITAEFLSGRRVGIRLEMEPETKVQKNLH